MFDWKHIGVILKSEMFGVEIHKPENKRFWLASRLKGCEINSGCRVHYQNKYVYWHLSRYVCRDAGVLLMTTRIQVASKRRYHSS